MIEAVLADPDLLGYYEPDEHLIVLRSGLTGTERRCVLEHELVHAELGHRGDHARRGMCGHLTGQQEERANRTAARRLIAVEDLIRVRLLYPDDPAQAAEELAVDVETLETRVRWLTSGERYALRRALEDQGEVA